ncbi:MAG: hypothetical protein HKN94_01280 [Acidimicrobiales bacterium]|nr:hypothetical protein [Acidimicrobiales bacterium]RZV46735.1 MAG: hypothetical protein EX269_06440 [Acidimicrobiales bacterium]
MLRASSDVSGERDVPHRAELEIFATALASGGADLDQRRDELRAAVGDEVFVEAAAVAAVFHGYVRVADGTGIPVDELVVATSGDLREELGINAYEGRANTMVDVAERPAAEFNPQLK